MEIISFYCECESRIPDKKCLDYKFDCYEDCNFLKLHTFDGKTKKTYTVENLKEIEFLFNKNTILVAFNAYFNFSLLYHELYKLGLDQKLDLELLGGTCCVTDLCNLLKEKLPKLSLKNAIYTYKRLIKDPRCNILMKECSQFWFYHGGKRIVNNNSGKWLIFLNKIKLPAIWEQIKLNEELLGYDQARMSTMAINIWGGKPNVGVIEVFYSDKKYKEILEFGEKIRQLCKNSGVKKILYKRDDQIGGSLQRQRHKMIELTI